MKNAALLLGIFAIMLLGCATVDKPIEFGTAQCENIIIMPPVMTTHIGGAIAAVPMYKKQAEVKLTDGTIKPLPLWVADFETGALQTISLEFNFPRVLFSEKIARENAAVLEIGKHMVPIFVNGNSYNDPGIFTIFNPITITNKHWQGKLDLSKKYQLTYKLNRQGSFKTGQLI